MSTKKPITNNKHTKKLESKTEYKVLEQHIVFDSPKIKVMTSSIKLPNGVETLWSHVTGDEIVAAVAVDAEDNIYLAKEWRIAAEDFIYSLPAGATEAKNEDERILEINRELQEEIGMKGNQIEKLTEMFSESHNNRKFHVYLVTDLEKSPLASDEAEIVGTHRIKIQEAIQFLTRKDIITTGTTLAGILLALQLKHDNHDSGN